jgi:hypothetical protein
MLIQSSLLFSLHNSRSRMLQLHAFFPDRGGQTVIFHLLARQKVNFLRSLVIYVAF